MQITWWFSGKNEIDTTVEISKIYVKLDSIYEKYRSIIALLHEAIW